MPLPTSSEQESLKSNPKPSLKPGMDVVPAVPRNPRKFSKLVLLTTSKNSTKVVGAKRKGVHCVMSLGVPGPATLARALLKTHPEAERAIEAAPQEPEAKHSKLDLGEDVEIQLAPVRDNCFLSELPTRLVPAPGPWCSLCPDAPGSPTSSGHVQEAGSTRLMDTGQPSLDGPQDPDLVLSSPARQPCPLQVHSSLRTAHMPCSMQEFEMQMARKTVE